MIAAEHLRERVRLIAGVLEVVAHRDRDVADIAGPVVKVPALPPEANTVIRSCPAG